MLNFIICDDETAITNTVKDIIVKTIFKTSIEYKIHVFHNYDDSFYEIIHSDLINKIYILDIEVNDKSGLEIAKEIRKRDNIPYEDEYDYEDWDDEYEEY